MPCHHLRAAERSDPSSAKASVAVLYSGQLRSVLSFPSIVNNHRRFFEGLFLRRSAWDSFLFADLGSPDGSIDMQQCEPSRLAPVMRVIAPVAVGTWAPSTDGEVPIGRVGGFCWGTNKSRSECLTKNETDRFNRAYHGYHRNVSVARIMRLKHHIYRAFTLMADFVESKRGGQQYEIVVRVRPDSWFDNQYTAAPGEPFTERTPLQPALVHALAQSGILMLPREWSWGGVNDRFAMGGYDEMRHYSNQFLHMQAGWPNSIENAAAFIRAAASGVSPIDVGERPQSCPGWIHSESFARCNLVRTGVTFVQLPVGLFLVRSDGRKQVLGHMVEGGLHSCSCISWLSTALQRLIPEHNYLERCGKALNLTTISSDPRWNVTAFLGVEWRFSNEKPCRGARWWRHGISTGHHEWGS